MVSNDITEKILAELALEASEQRFRSIFENSTVGIVLASPNGDILFSNEAFLNIVGYSEDEMMNLNFEVFTHPDFVKNELKYTESVHNSFASRTK